MKAMILAAGKGTRMLPLTKDRPKPLLMVAGKSLIHHQIEKLVSNGITDIVINHSYLGEQIEEELGDGQELGVNLQYSPEEFPLETAGGILQALPLFGSEPFVVVNADVWTNYPFSRLPILNAKDKLAHLVMVANQEHNLQGDFVLDHGLLKPKGINEPSALTFSGISVFHPDFFSGIGKGVLALRPLLDAGMEKQQISGELFEGEWVDVGTPERLKKLQSTIT